MNKSADHQILKPLRMRLAGWLALWVALAMLATLGGLALLAVLLDAMVDLPLFARLTAPWVLIAATGAVLLGGIWEWRRLSEARVARLFEKADPRLGSRLINSVQLGQQPGATPVEEFLRREAVENGRRTAAALQARPVAWRNLKQAGVFLGVTVLAWVALVGFQGDLVHAVIPRFLDPHGDHPPYSRLHFQVEPGATNVLYGGQVEIRVKTSGRPVDQLWLVAWTGTNVSRTPMFLAPDRSFFQTLANLRQPTEYFVTDNSARSLRYPVHIRYTPQITQVEVSMMYPKYTALPTRLEKLPDEPQALPAGTRVTFRVASNRPLKSGLLELTPVLGGKPVSVVLEPDAQQKNVVMGRFRFRRTAAFKLTVRDITGLDCAEPRRGRFNLLPDQPPQLFVLAPGRDAVATPNVCVPVRVQASDDYGVSRVTWLRGFNGSIERPFQMKLARRDGARSVEGTNEFNLAELGVHPGDVIQYYFEAADNDPQGPNVVFSRPFRLEIISRAQYEAILRQAAAQKALFESYLKLDSFLRRLAERSRTLASEATHSNAAARAEAQGLEKELAAYERQLHKLLGEPTMFDVEQSFRAVLAAQQTRVSSVLAGLKAALASGVLDPKQLKAWSKELTALSQQEQIQVGQPARQIASVARVLAEADAFVRLAQQERTLADRLRRFADDTNALTQLERMEVRALANEQHRIRHALRTLVWQQLPELLAAVPNDKQFDPLRGDVKAFLQAVTAEKIDDDLTGAATALDRPDLMTGYALAKMAAEKMNQLIARCNGMPPDAHACLVARFRPTLVKPGLGNTLAQILAALGAGNGQGGRNGYALFNDAVAMYGPNVELAGAQAGGRRATSRSGGMKVERLVGPANAAGKGTAEAAGQVRLQPQARFPLRYRDLVGEYFRVIAETQEQGVK